MEAHEAACNLETALARYETVMESLALLAAERSGEPSAIAQAMLRRLAASLDPELRALYLQASPDASSTSSSDPRDGEAWTASLAQKLVAAASTYAMEMNQADIALRKALDLHEVREL